jgi:hypothetical protein
VPDDDAVAGTNITLTPVKVLKLEDENVPLFTLSRGGISFVLA